MRDLLALRNNEGFLLQPDESEMKKQRDEFGVRLRKSKRIQVTEMKRKIFKSEGLPGMDYCLYIGKLPESIIGKFPVLDKLNSEYSKLAALKEIAQDPGLSPGILLDILRLFRQTLQVDDEANPRALFLNVGLINTLSSIITKSTDPNIQSEAIWCLCNIAAGPSDYSIPILDTNILPTLLSLIPKSSESIIENATWLLANLLSDSQELLKSLITQGYLQIIENLSIFTEKVAVGVSISLVNLTKDSSLLDENDYLSILRILSRVKCFDDSDMLWVISNLCKGESHKIDLVIQSGIVQAAFDGILKGSKYSLPSSEILCNISAGNKKQTDFLLENNILGLVENVIFAEDDQTVKCVFCTLRNIAAGNSRQRQIIQKHPIFFKSMNGLIHSSFEVRFQAVHFFFNICLLASFEEILALVEAGIFSHLSHTLNDYDPLILIKSLEICFNILKAKESFPQIEINLKESGCLSSIQELLLHLNSSVSSASDYILSTLH